MRLRYVDLWRLPGTGGVSEALIEEQRVERWPPPSTGSAARAVTRLRETLTAHTSDDGIWFNSRAWIVTARRH
jgi:hypothetical protein